MTRAAKQSRTGFAPIDPLDATNDGAPPLNRKFITTLAHWSCHDRPSCRIRIFAPNKHRARRAYAAPAIVSGRKCEPALEDSLQTGTRHNAIRDSARLRRL